MEICVALQLALATLLSSVWEKPVLKISFTKMEPCAAFQLIFATNLMFSVME